MSSPYTTVTSQMGNQGSSPVNLPKAKKPTDPTWHYAKRINHTMGGHPEQATVIYSLLLAYRAAVIQQGTEKARQEGYMMGCTQRNGDHANEARRHLDRHGMPTG